MSEIVSPIALWKAVFCSYCIGVFAGCSGTEEQTSIDAPEIISSSQLIKDTGGRTTYIGSNTYYTGTVIDYYGDGKSIRYRATYEDGLRTGEEAEFRKDGQPTRGWQTPWIGTVLASKRAPQVGNQLLQQLGIWGLPLVEYQRNQSPYLYLYQRHAAQPLRVPSQWKT